MSKSKKWTEKDYITQAEDIVATYGKGYCWEDLVYEYMDLCDPSERVDAGRLLNAILAAEKRA
jgi:hypothetical protein